MSERRDQMLKTHAVGIDLGTTYSCISYLNEHGEPVTLANQEGELSTPSVVLFDKTGEIIVGTEALRNSVIKPSRVVENSKRSMGDATKTWVMDGTSYTPIDIAKLVLRKLLDSAENQIGTIEQAVITVPAQFSEIQRQWTVEAGMLAGLKRVDVINEPVAAALCYVLGSEGLWFTELADEQCIMVYDLGGGTFDLSLVKYHKNEVKVITSAGDLNLGGIDWNKALLNAIARQFQREFRTDPRKFPKSLQFLALEVENAKRSMTVRPRTALTAQHGTDRKSYQVEQSQFERLTQKHVDRTCDITEAMLKDNKMGWAHVDVVLTVGGASRMPMIRNALKKLGGRTLNTSLSPDQSISHGATYYAGMLLTNSDFAKSILNEEVTQRLASIKQQNVNSRGLGIIVRDQDDNRLPHYLIPANTPLPADARQMFGTVIPNQKRVHLRIVESGTAGDDQYVELGTCIVEDLPPNLPQDSQVEVTISYNDQARVKVTARDVKSGKQAQTEIVRDQNAVVKKDEKAATSKARPAAKPAAKSSSEEDWKAEGLRKRAAVAAKAQKKKPKPRAIDGEDDIMELMEASAEDVESLGGGDTPVPLCNECGEPLDHRGDCPQCGASKKSRPKKPPKPGSAGEGRGAGGTKKVRVRPEKAQAAEQARAKTPRKASDGATRGVKVRKAGPTSSPSIPVDDDEILELEFTEGSKKKPTRKSGSERPKPQPKAKSRSSKPGAKKPSVKAPPLPPALSKKDGGKSKGGDSMDDGEEEFWQLAD